MIIIYCLSLWSLSIITEMPNDDTRMPPRLGIPMSGGTSWHQLGNEGIGSQQRGGINDDFFQQLYILYPTPLYHLERLQVQESG